MNKSDLRIGNKVKWNGKGLPVSCFGFSNVDVTKYIESGATLTIVGVDNDPDTVFNINVRDTTSKGLTFNRWVNSDLFDLVEKEYTIKPLMPPFYRGAKVQVRQLESEDWSKEPHVFVGRIDGAAKSNCCVDNNIFDVKAFDEDRPFNTVNWRFVKHYVEKEYEPYTELDVNWLKKGYCLTRKRDGVICQITSLRKGNKLGINMIDKPTVGVVKTLKEAFKEYNFTQLDTPFGREVVR